MREHDYVALETAARAGRFAEVTEALGIELTADGLQRLEQFAATFGLRRSPIADAFALMALALRAPSGIAVQRLEQGSGRFLHRLAVVWQTKQGADRLTFGMQRSVDRRAIGNAWPALAGWKAKLEQNQKLATAWASDPQQLHRVEFAVTARPKIVVADGAEEDALLKAIVAAPDDDAPRLVYADWLQERGDARGEFIRLQIELHRRRDEALRKRLNVMLGASWQNFAGELAKYVTPRSFVRGFPTTVALTGPVFQKHGERFFSRWPLERLDFDNRHFTPQHLEQLVSAPAISRVRHLALEQIDSRAKARLERSRKGSASIRCTPSSSPTAARARRTGRRSSASSRRRSSARWTSIAPRPTRCCSARWRRTRSCPRFVPSTNSTSRPWAA